MNRAVSPATSARAFAEAKHRHTATINARPASEYVETVTAPIRNEKLRSHAELTLRKEFHKYTPHEINTARLGTTYHVPVATTDTLAFSPSSRVILATGDVLQSPQARGEVFNSHRAFTAAKSRHYTPHRARDANVTTTNHRASHQPTESIQDSLPGPVFVKRVDSDSARCVRTSSSNRGTPRNATDSYTRTSTPDARVPGGQTQSKAYGTTSHHLSYGYMPAAGSPSRTARGAGRRVYTMPKLSNIIY